MKKILFIISLFITVMSQAQEYSFVPKGLKIISMEELMKKGPPSSLDLVYYEDGTKTTLQEVMPKLMQGELTPKMFVDNKGDYKALVAIKEYSFVPKELKLISQEELMKKGLPSNLDLVYYEDGTKTTLQEVMPMIMHQELDPKMYVNEKGDCKLLVVVNNKPIEIKINYTNIPEHLSNLGCSFGNPESDIVIVNTQGGPLPNLLAKEFESFFVNEGGINPKKVFVINVHQVQTLYPERFNEKEITFEQAIESNKESTKILFDIVSYFKSQNKTVYVTGFSIGAFAGVDLLAEYGNIADGYLLMVGRLDMTEKVWKIFSKGSFVNFKEDGIEVDVSDNQNDESVLEKNLSKLAAGFGHKRYTQLLKDVDLSNVIYVYGKKDQNVGRLTQKEVDFLKSKKVNLIAKDAGHEIMGTYLKEALELLLKK